MLKEESIQTEMCTSYCQPIISHYHTGHQTAKTAWNVHGHRITE